MGIYISSKGEEKDTTEMAYPYLVNALNKARDNGDQANIDVLQAELDSRPDPESETNLSDVNDPLDTIEVDEDVDLTSDEDFVDDEILLDRQFNG